MMKVGDDLKAIDPDVGAGQLTASAVFALLRDGVLESAGKLKLAAFEKKLAPVAIAELDPIRVGADGVIAGSQSRTDFEVNPRRFRGNDLASGAQV